MTTTHELRVIHSARELFATTEALRAGGERIGLVPTMGALHAGHLSLVAALRDAGSTRIVTSVFVNPTQFGPNEDFAKYPRTWDEDLARLGDERVDFVYAPDKDQMYPVGFQTHVEVERTTQGLEGSVRPTHFRGVTTVVAKLFNATGPCIAAFGRKDYQQWRAIERMVRDLDVPVRVLGCPIVREPDGLAMSSRNRYLAPEARARAVAIHAGLSAASAAFANGERATERLRALATAPIASAFDSIDYVALADADELAPAAERVPERCVMLIAARLGPTRLIDNALLGQECLG